MKTQRKSEATLEVKGRVFPSTKREAEEVFRHYHLSTSQAINLFFHAVAESKSLSLNLKMPNKATQKAMDDVKKGIGLKEFNNVQEMLDDLHSEDE